MYNHPWFVKDRNKEASFLSDGGLSLNKLGFKQIWTKDSTKNNKAFEIFFVRHQDMHIAKDMYLFQEKTQRIWQFKP